MLDQKNIFSITLEVQFETNICFMWYITKYVIESL